MAEEHECTLRDKVVEASLMGAALALMQSREEHWEEKADLLARRVAFLADRVHYYVHGGGQRDEGEGSP